MVVVTNRGSFPSLLVRDLGTIFASVGNKMVDRMKVIESEIPSISHTLNMNIDLFNPSFLYLDTVFLSF